MAPRLQLSGLRWHVGARQILSDVGLQVAAGEVVGLLGPNGSGKSSVLRALLGLVPADVNALLLDGARVRLGEPALRRQLGVVFQGGSLDGKLTCLENLRLGARLYGLRGAAAEARCAEALATMELGDRANERAELLSGGLRRRLELGRALLHRPGLLLLDEPTQGLDPLAQRRLWDTLSARCAEDGLTILLSTHDAEEAACCTRVVVLVAGRVVACDTPAALLARVGGDVLMLSCAPGESPADVAERAHEALGVPARVQGDTVSVEHAEGHTVVPRLVQAVGAARLRAVSVRRPTLADAFYALTGASLAGDGAPAAPEKR